VKWLIRLPSRLLLATLMLLVIILVIVLGSLTWLLGSEAGGRWVLEQVPGLEVSDFEGRLGGDWQASELLYTDGDLQVRIASPLLSWRPGCLTQLMVCLDKVHTGAIAVALPDAAPEDDEAGDTPFALPDISLPVTIRLADLDIGPVSIDGETQLDGAYLSARIGRRDLEIRRLQIKREDLQAGLQGTLRMRDDWPLSLRLDLSYDLFEDQPLVTQARLGGSIERLTLNADFSSPWVANIAGRVEPLKEGFPLALTLTADQFQGDQALPEELTLLGLVLSMEGDMEQGWDVDGNSQLATEPSLDVALQGHVDLEGARVDRLRISDGASRHLTLADSHLSWQDGLEADGSLAWRHFPWQRLLPEQEMPPVVLEQLDMTFALADDKYEADLHAGVMTPEGPVSLMTPVRGDFTQVSLPALELVAEQGRISGRADVDFADILGWDVDLALQDIDPGLWVEELAGNIAGDIRSQGRLEEEGPVLTADLMLQGDLRDQPLTLEADARMDRTEWQLNKLLLSLGDNRIEGSASQNTQGQITAALDLALDKLDQLWPGLAGRISGDFRGEDLLGEPSGDASIALEEIRYLPLEISLESLTLAADLDARQQGSAALDWSAFVMGEQAIDEGSLRLDGGEESHQIELKLVHAMAQLELAARGGLDRGAWAGNLTRGRIQGLDQDWQLDTEASLQVDMNDTIALGAHCWRWEEASLCAEDQVFFPEQKVRLRLDNLPTAAFADVLPDDVRWDEMINGQIVLDIDGDGPRGEVWVDAGQGQFGLRQTLDPDDIDAQDDPNDTSDSRWISLDYEQLRVAADLSSEEVRLQFNLAGPELGEVVLDTRMDATDDSYPLDGTMALRDLNLSLARPFLDMDELAGTIAGEARIGGVLTSPDVAGELVLSNGRLLDPRIPLPIDDLNLSVTVAGTEARIQGELKSGSDGRADISGLIDWQEVLRAEVDIDGDQLPVNIEPFAELVIVPRLEIRFDQEEGLFVGGRLGVPSGAVKIRELPETAVQVSDDEEVIGEEDNGEPMQVRMDLVVVVGEDQVTFDGFGVTGNLEGRLRLLDDMEARGELSLQDGRYQIYGQRLEIRRARVIFAGPLDEPFLDIEAVRVVGNVTAGIRLTGRADDPQTEIFSDPSMSDSQALSYLLLGRPLQTEGDSNVVGEVALALGLAQTAPMTRDIGERFGVQDLQLQTEGTGDEASVVASGYITDRISLRYGVGLFQPVNRVAVRYDISQRMFVEAASGLASSLDIFYQRDYWGGFRPDDE